MPDCPLSVSGKVVNFVFFFTAAAFSELERLSSTNMYNLIIIVKKKQAYSISSAVGS